MYVHHIRSTDKFKAFNFHVIDIDAHDFDQIAACIPEGEIYQGNADRNHCKDVSRARA